MGEGEGIGGEEEGGPSSLLPLSSPFPQS